MIHRLQPTLIQQFKYILDSCYNGTAHECDTGSRSSNASS